MPLAAALTPAAEGSGYFEDPMVEPLIKAFLHHYLFDGRKDLFTGIEVTQPEESCQGCSK